MAVFLPQARAEMPQNAMLDFSPINNAIDGNRRNAMMAQQQDVQRQELGMRREQMDMQKQRFDDEQQKSIRQKFGALAQVVDAERDPNRRAQMWTRITRMHPGASGLDQSYLDPMQGPKMLMAEAGLFKDPMEQQTAQAKLGLINAQTAHYRAQAAGGSGGKAPSGYRQTADGNLEPIPGGPADAITGEQAARVGLMTNAISYLPDVRGVFLGEADEANPGQFKNPKMGMGLGSHWDFQLDRGDIADAKRKMAVGIEGILRAQTGAAATPEEVNRELAKYLPRPEDTQQTRMRKLQLYEDTLRRTISINTRGTTSSSLRQEIDGMTAPRASVPGGAIQLLQGNPSPEVIQQFEQKYGRGSAAQYLQRR